MRCTLANKPPINFELKIPRTSDECLQLIMLIRSLVLQLIDCVYDFVLHTFYCISIYTNIFNTYILSLYTYAFQ